MARKLSNSPTAVRKRRERERKRHGQVVIKRLVLDDELIDGLVAVRWIGEWDRDDPDALAEALIEGLRQDLRHA